MEFRYRYAGSSQASSDAKGTDLSFAPDSLRPPTYFVGKLRHQIPFREAISALHEVVISDLRFKPKDKEDYKRWLAQEESRLLAEFLTRKQTLKTRINALSEELAEINRSSDGLLKPYYDAQREYFSYLYKANIDAWYVLDPVITINPDEIFFECFSEDESSYGKLSCRYDAFRAIEEKACGTTNIDYSEGLYTEFQKIRNYRETRLQVDPGGFAVTTSGSDEFEEKKIDLPESWVRGFLQVSSAMTLPTYKIHFHPMDIHNLCQILRRNKERVGPRAISFNLQPGQPVTVNFEPWKIELKCPRSLYMGSEAQQIRIWGRRRLHILERLIPVAEGFTVHLLGSGLPSFFIAHMQDMTFTLGLSGWTANDWSRIGNFDLLAPRQNVDEITLKRVFKTLQQQWFASAESLSNQLQLAKPTIQSALSIYSQHGQVLYDLDQGVYRIRELSREPLPFNQLRYSNEREEKAQRFVAAQLVHVQKTYQQNIETINGTVKDNGVDFHAELSIDADFRLQNASCECHFYKQNHLRQGPCEHVLALRIAANKFQS